MSKSSYRKSMQWQSTQLVSRLFVCLIISTHLHINVDYSVNNGSLKKMYHTETCRSDKYEIQAVSYS